MPFALLLGGLLLAIWAVENTSPQPAGDAGGPSPGPSPDNGNGSDNASGSALAQAAEAAAGTSNPGGAGSDVQSQGPFEQALAETPYADLIATTEDDNGIPQNLLASILYQESRFNANAINKNSNGTRDTGIAQINSIHDSEISEASQLDPTQAIPWAGQFLAGLYATHGTWREAVTAYNGSGPAAMAYADKVLNNVSGVA